MSDRIRRVLGWALTVAGGLLLLFGIWFIAMYVWGVIDVLDEADRSWMFWGLAILFIGIGAAGAGVGALVGGRQMRRADQSRDR